MTDSPDWLHRDEVDGSDQELAETLAAAGLPTEDLAEPGRRFWRFRTAVGEPIGFIGWEDMGGAALLRSLVIVPAQRGQGWSRILTDWALAQLAAAGIADVYVLTTSVESLAQRFGFSRVLRDQAPPAIRASRQFASLCPASAVLLHRRLS